MIWAALASAALFLIFGLVALRCDCSANRCAGCPFKESKHET